MSTRTHGVVCALLLAFGAPVFVSQEYKTNLPGDDPAIRYGHLPVDDAAAKIAHELEQGTLTLDARSGSLGVLPALLDRLHVNADSQMLVFSKTSFQAARISPDRPRAIYFNDDLAVAYVPGAPSLEIAAVDPVQGPVFYTMAIGAAGRPLVSHGDTCLRCHQGPNTNGVPGLYVGSVIPGPTGAPLRDDTAIITDHRTAFKDRWGGWYVTAKRGEQLDRANATASNPAEPEALIRESRQNLPSLLGLFDPAPYLAASSDIVALMTFEHQTQMTNRITRVGWDARLTAHDGSGTLAARGETLAAFDGRCIPGGCVDPRSNTIGILGRRALPAGRLARLGATPDFHHGLLARGALDEDVDDLVEYMLFTQEAPLTEPVEGVSSFARTFPQRGPRDHLGRSLRDFDLQTRLFRYRLSYMIYSAAFDALPSDVRAHVYRRLHDVLIGADRRAVYSHLTADERRAILEILRDTKPDLPAYWRATE